MIAHHMHMCSVTSKTSVSIITKQHVALTTMPERLLLNSNQDSKVIHPDMTDMSQENVCKAMRKKANNISTSMQSCGIVNFKIWLNVSIIQLH